MEVAGVDGYRRGWVSVALEEGAFQGARLHGSFADVLSAYPEARVIAVDIPIGLPQKAELRAADVAAKKFLAGSASTVFPVPPRPVLQSATYKAARELAVTTWSQGLSAQSFALASKILEVEAHAGDDRIYEVHPEVSFRAVKGKALSARKKSWNGATERRTLLHQAGIVLPDHIEDAGDVVFDDLLDAAAAAWSARRIAMGLAHTLPEEPERIGSQRVAIWY